MRIATYNVWNENKGIGNRLEQILKEIRNVGADLIALQEITPEFYREHLLNMPEYPYSEFGKYTGEDEGLAILSKYPFTNRTFLHTDRTYMNSCALNVLVNMNSIRISVTDVHLPWNSIKIKEEQIVAIDRFCHEQSALADYFIVLGDFNCGINSSVHRFMTGEQTIYGSEAKPYWYEVSSVYAAIKGQSLLPTLDCINNPRWKGKDVTYAPENFDRIYVMDVRNGYRFDRVELFGTEVNPVNNLCASDHYGVMSDIEFLKMSKVIFLDIDGVLNSGFWNEKHQKEISDGALIDKEKIRLLAGLCAKTDARIILHSGWRFWFDEGGTPLRSEAGRLVSLLAQEGLKISGMTPDLTTEEIRKTKKFSLVKADEILLWLKKHPETSGWVVLDDLVLHNETVAGHQVKPDAEVGLTLENILEAERILEQKWDAGLWDCNRESERLTAMGR